MTRSSRASYIKSDFTSKKKTFCFKCEEYWGIQILLVDRFLENDVGLKMKDDKFRICPRCGDVVPVYQLKYLPEYGPSTYIVKNPFETGTKVKLNKVSGSRKVKKKSIEAINIPKLAGKTDTLVKEKLDEGAVLLSLADFNTE